jgi:hypothetical protein
MLRRDCYECTLSHAGLQYMPCAWFAFYPPRAADDLVELDRLWAANPEAQKPA